MSTKEKIKKYQEAEQGTADEDIPQTKDARMEEKKVESEPKNEVIELQEKLEAAQNESKENYDRLLRISAEFDNYKKRTARETEDFRKYANATLVKELLSVVDNLERAIDSAKDNADSTACVVQGVQMTHQEILKIFGKFGVKPIESLDKPFDPNFHQAIMQEPTSEKSENVVLREMQTGYMMHDRLIRPAMVVVSKSPEASEKAEESETEIKADNNA